jgi:tartrate dehydratase beta subunit/fumarate hydratase class I family protein
MTLHEFPVLVAIDATGRDLFEIAATGGVR